MKLNKIGLSILCLVVGFLSCKKDDDGGVIAAAPPRDRAEQQVTDKTLLLDYLETHYYNSNAFGDANTVSIKDLIITKLNSGETVPDGNTLLIDKIITKELVFANTDYEIYYLELNKGAGVKSPTFSGNIFVAYEGFTLDNEVFDSAVSPVNFELVGNGVTTSGLIPGWRKVLPEFNIAQSFVESGDGTIDYMNHGAGVMFLPSGLAYFNTIVPGIDAYEPIAFKFDLYDTSFNDHDGDGVPSYLEDINGNDGEFIVNQEDPDNDDDTDNDGLPNYVDADDDGDGIPTLDEDANDDGDPTNDIGANGIPKYLDPEETESK